MTDDKGHKGVKDPGMEVGGTTSPVRRRKGGKVSKGKPGGEGGGTTSPVKRRPGTPAPELAKADRPTSSNNGTVAPPPGEMVRSPSKKRRQRFKKPTQAVRPRRRCVIFAFLVGTAVGVLAIVFSQYYLPPDYYKQLKTYIEHLDINFPSINISLPSVPSVGLDVNVTILNDVYSFINRAPETAVGLEAAAKGWRGKYPIVLIPGFVTSGLEVWEGEACASKYFRQRMWGTLTMLQTMVFQGECWSRHMALNMTTGLDPEGIRLRAAQGLEAADYFMPGFWVWAKLIRDFAHLGYDHNNLILMSYDWRLSLPDLERRDHYFTHLKSRIETMVRVNNQKMVMITHSYGSNVMLYFFKWVESEKGGKGGNKWVADHIETFVNIAGPLLGVIKAAPSYVSGEMHDSAELGPIEDIIFGSNSSAFNRRRRRELFRTWGSLTAMLPKGGNALWGNLTAAPEDPAGMTASAENPPPGKVEVGAESGDNPDGGACSAEDAANGSCRACPDCAAPPVFHHGQVIGFSDAGLPSNWTVEDVLGWLKRDDEDLRRRMEEEYDFGYVSRFGKEHDHPRYWTNPMSLQLPHAPKLKVVCYYGVGKPTERAYVYKTADGQIDQIDTNMHQPALNMSDGVVMGEGDGTVTLMSLGYHCSKLWRQKSHNPASVHVTTRELLHADSGMTLISRGGGSSGDHVDIMGNHEMASEIMALVTGNEEEVLGKDRYFSRVQELADRVRLL